MKLGRRTRICGADCTGMKMKQRGRRWRKQGNAPVLPYVYSGQCCPSFPSSIFRIEVLEIRVSPALQQNRDSSIGGHGTHDDYRGVRRQARFASIIRIVRSCRNVCLRR